MARLVIVSNRVPIPKARGTQAGGLAVALARSLDAGNDVVRLERAAELPSRRRSPPWSRRAASPTPRSI